MDDARLRTLVPEVIGVLVRRGNDFASAEDAVQDALVDALRTWGTEMPTDPKGWLVRVAGRRLVDVRRSEAARRRREDVTLDDPAIGLTEQADDTLLLFFLCCHPALSPASAIALTLRAVGGLTTRQIAEAFLVPEPTMAQRISRAKRTVEGAAFTRPADVALVLHVVYLIFTTGHAGEVDLEAEAIRLARLLALESDEPEVSGLLALLLLTHARRPARTDAAGALVTLDEQDRTLWDTAMIAEAVGILQAALAHDRRGPYQVQAAIAALHDDATSAAETDWRQILDWYDELLTFGDNPVAELSRAVALGEIDGAHAGLRALDGIDVRLPEHHRLDAVRGHLHERAGELDQAIEHYRRAADRTPSKAEREHLMTRAARLRNRDRGGRH